MTLIFHQQVTVVRPGTRVDRGGNEIADWSAAIRAAVGPVSVQPNTQHEETEPDRTAVVTGWRVISAPGVDADVRSGDRVEWDGMTLEVAGEVARWPDPLEGGVHHIEFTVRRATG